MKEIESQEIELALRHERLLEPSKFGLVALDGAVDELVTEVKKLDRYVADRLEVTPVVQQRFDSLDIDRS